MKLDMHCHTKEGSIDGTLPLLENIEILKSKGYQGMLITDHDSYHAYEYWEELAEKPDFVVLRGIEYDTFEAGHIIVVMPSGVRPKVIGFRGLPINILIDVVHRYGGILGPAHPYGEIFQSYVNTRYGHHHMDLIKKFDFIESFNACEGGAANAAAGALAKLYDRPVFGGSDSHRTNAAGFGYTIIDEDIKTESELVDYIKAKKPTMAGGEFYMHTARSKIGPAKHIFNYLFWAYNKSMALVRTPERRTAFHRIKKANLTAHRNIAKHYTTLE